MLRSLLCVVLLVIGCAQASQTADALPPLPCVADPGLPTDAAADDAALCGDVTPPLPSPPRFSVTPTNAGLSLSPFGVSLEVSLFSPALLPDRVSATVGYDQGTVADVKVYGFVQYDVSQDVLLPDYVVPLDVAVQGGSWLHDPHLTGLRTTALGIKGQLRAALPDPALPLSTSVEVALIQLATLGPAYVFDGRTEVALTQLESDRWGYTTAGWRGALTRLWSATAATPSLALWADGTHTTSMDGAWRLTTALRAGYRPAWPVPLTVTSELATLGTLGVGRSLTTRLVVLSDLLTLERISVEPRLHSWIDQDVHVGADITLSADTLVTTRLVAVSSTFGYTDTLWARFGLRLSP